MVAKYTRTFLEYLVDSCSETLLFEMAYTRKVAMLKITDRSAIIFDHVLKILVLDIPQTHNHWYREINAQLYDYNRYRIKPSNKKVSGDQIYDWFFNRGDHFDSKYIDFMIKVWLSDDYRGVQTLPYNSEELLHTIQTVLKRVFTDIGEDEFVTIKDYI